MAGIGAGSRHALHGLSQGAVSRLGGGSFRGAFLGGSLGHWAGGHFGRALGGGKFANGARAAAFAHLFNNEAAKFREQARKEAIRKMITHTLLFGEGNNVELVSQGGGGQGCPKFECPRGVRGDHKGSDLMPSGSVKGQGVTVHAPFAGELRWHEEDIDGYGYQALLHGRVRYSVNGQDYEDAVTIRFVHMGNYKKKDWGKDRWINAGDHIGVSGISGNLTTDMNAHVHVEVLFSPSKEDGFGRLDPCPLFDC